MHCTRCAAALEERARFCGSCGAATGHAAATAQRDSMPISGRPASPAAFWIIGAVVGILIIFVILGNVSRMVGSTADSSFDPSYASASQAMRQAVNGGLSGDCTPGNFKIKEQHGTNEYGFLTVVGVIHNGCDQDAGVQLKLNQYDAHGNLIATDDQWPAGVSDISPHQDYDFKVMASAPDAAVRYSVFPISVQRW